MEPIVCVIVDNGSVHPASTISLRALAVNLKKRLNGVPVVAASVNYSDRISSADLNGEPAFLLKTVLHALVRFLEVVRIVVVPLFFGPGYVVSTIIPKIIKAAKGNIEIAGCLVDTKDVSDNRIAKALAENIEGVTLIDAIQPITVVLVNHGTPSIAVHAVRKLLKIQLDHIFGERAIILDACMERRIEPKYDFNGLTLSDQLTTMWKTTQSKGTSRDVVISMQFLLPGKHAGPEGDVAHILTQAETRGTGLRTYMTDLLSDHPILLDVLVDRFMGSK